MTDTTLKTELDISHESILWIFDVGTFLNKQCKKLFGMNHWSIWESLSFCIFPACFYFDLPLYLSFYDPSLFVCLSPLSLFVCLSLIDIYIYVYAWNLFLFSSETAPFILLSLFLSLCIFFSLYLFLFVLLSVHSMHLFHSLRPSLSGVSAHVLFLHCFRVSSVLLHLPLSNSIFAFLSSAPL